MTRRVIASILWAYFGWYLAALLLAMLGLPSAMAPAGAIAVLAIAWLDLGLTSATETSPTPPREAAKSRSPNQ